MKRIYSIDLFRLYFAFVIAFGHFDYALPGHMFAVELFFVISGFFLAKKFYAKSYIAEGLFTPQDRYNHKQYTWDHIKSLYPHYLFSLVVVFLYSILPYVKSVLISSDKISSAYLAVRAFYNAVPELLMVQNIGFFNGGINYPTWQICAIIIAGYFIYTLMYYSEKLSTEFVLPVAFILFETYWIVGRDPFSVLVCIAAEIARAFAFMAFGVLIFKFTQSNLYTAVKCCKIPHNLFSIFMILSLFIFNLYNGVHIIGFAVLLLYLYDGNCWLNRILNLNIFKHFGNLSYAIYLNHVIVINIFKDIISYTGMDISNAVKYSVFTIVLTVYSVITLKIADKIKAAFSR